MASYSVAAVQEQLPELIERVLAGEEVVIAREGGQTVELRAVPPLSPEEQRKRNAASLEPLRRLRESLPVASVTYLQGKYQDEEERRY